jgi:hypothetical protein
VTLPHWYERYNQVLCTCPLPRTRKEQEELAQAIGADALYLLEKIGVNTSLALTPEVQSLWQECRRQFNQSAHDSRWRSPFCAVCQERLAQG